MKKFTLPLAIVALGASMFAADASAQRLIVETPGVRLATPGGRGGRVAYDLDRLNREVRQVRFEIRAYRGEGRRIRYRFDRVARAAERLNYEFDRGANPWVIRRRIEQVRAELYEIREDLRFRGDRPRSWR